MYIAKCPVGEMRFAASKQANLTNKLTSLACDLLATACQVSAEPTTPSELYGLECSHSLSYVLFDFWPPMFLFRTKKQLH